MKTILTVIIILWTNNIFGQIILEKHWNERFNQLRTLYQKYEMEPIEGVEISISDSMSTIRFNSLTVKNKSGTTWIETNSNKEEVDILNDAETTYLITLKLFRALRPKVKKKIKTQTGEAYTMRSPFLFGFKIQLLYFTHFSTRCFPHDILFQARSWKKYIIIEIIFEATTKITVFSTLFVIR
jgi:hypothetical protein